MNNQIAKPSLTSIDNITPKQRRTFVSNYLNNGFDECLAVQDTFGEDIPRELAGIKGRWLLRQKKVVEKVNQYVLSTLINPDRLKIDLYKLSRELCQTGQVRVKAIELLMKCQGMLEEKNVTNNYNLSWEQLIVNAHKEKEKTIENGRFGELSRSLRSAKEIPE